MNEYQVAAGKTAIYPNRGTGEIGAVSYTVLGLCGEAGELANKLKKILRDDDGVVTDARRLEMVRELGDALWYAAMVAVELGVPLSRVADDNLQRLTERRERDKLRGSGDER